MFEADGSPFYGNLREILQAVCHKLAIYFVSTVVALEMEFYLT